MSKERLEEILNNLPYSIRHSGEIEELKEFAREQVERAEELERKHEYALDDLEIFKRNYKEKRLESRRYKQALEELEETNKKNYWIAADFKFENLKLEQQNRRYREALEEIKKKETVTTALSKGQVAYTISGHIACKALEGIE